MMRTLPTRLGLDRPVAQWSLLLASLLVVLLGARTMIVTRRLQQEVERLQAANRGLEDREWDLQRQLADARSRSVEATKPAAQERSASFVFSMGMPAGGGAPRKLVIPADTEIVRLQLSLPRPSRYESYRVGLRGAPGDEFWSQGRLQPVDVGQGTALRVMLPAAALAPGHYELALRGQIAPARMEDVGYYYFEVVRKN